MGRRAAPVQLSLALEKPSDDTSVGYYIYNKVGGGYAIVSADDTQAPIIGYSDNGHIDADGIPDNMRLWLDGFYRKARAEEQTDYPDAIEPMITSHWGQNAPYNLQTPLFNGVHAPAGCGAVALAQIIRYQHWPDTVGYIPKTSQCEELPPTAFDWDKLLDTYDANSPVDCQEEVAKLMRYAGQAIKTYYGKESSSVGPFSLEANCRNYLRFEECRFDQDSNEYLSSSIYNSLKGGDPVLCGASTNSGSGHAFVCDGYQDGYFHINWGWKGACDGYFLISDLSPNSTTHYTRQKYVLTGLHKPDNPLPLDTIYSPAADISVKDMRYNPLVSTPGCLTRHDAADDFKGIVVDEDRTILSSYTSKNIRYGLALFRDDTMLEVLADTLLDLGINTRERQLTFRLSFGADLPDGSYQIKSVSRHNKYHPWEVNQKGDWAYLNATIEEDTLTLSYSVNTAKELVFNLATGFTGDDKFIEVSGEGREVSGSSMRTSFSYSGGSGSHYYDYGLSLCQGGQILQVDTVYLERASSNAEELLGYFDFEMENLPDGEYQLRGVYRECGTRNWAFEDIYSDSSHVLSLVKQGGRVFRETSAPSGVSFSYMFDSPIWGQTNIYRPNQSSSKYDMNFDYSFSKEGKGFFDCGLALFQGDSLLSVLSSHSCLHSSESSGSFNDTIHIPSTLPDGEYLLKGIARDANTDVWKEASRIGLAYRNIVIVGDSLFSIEPEQYNLRCLRVDSLMYLDDNHLRVFMTNTGPYGAEGLMTIKFLTALPDNAEGSTTEPAVIDSMSVYISHVEGYNSSWTDVYFRVRATDSLYFSCGPFMFDHLITTGQGCVKPLITDLMFDGMEIYEADNGSWLSNSLFDTFKVWIPRPVTDIPADFNPNVIVKLIDDAGDCLWQNDVVFGDNNSFQSVLVSPFTKGKAYTDYIGRKAHIELGYKRYFNDTLMCFSSHDYLIEPYVTMQTFQDNELFDIKQIIKEDSWTTPENALYVAFDNAIATEGHLDILPNSNPNTVYRFRPQQAIPQGLEGCHTISSDKFFFEEFHVVDSFPLTDKLRVKKAYYQLHINDDEWVLLGLPFTKYRMSKLDAQFKDVRVFDYYWDGVVHFRIPTEKELNRDGIFLVRGDGSDVSMTYDDFPTLKGFTDKYAFSPLLLSKQNIPWHYDEMYQLQPDGSQIILTEGDVLPFRVVIQHYVEELPDTLKVVIEGFEPTAITDISEQPQLRMRYATDGRAVGDGYRGIVIEVDGKGKARKVVGR